MNDKYKTLIDIKEFQTKILEFIASDEIDKFFNTAVFADIPECKQAMIYGTFLHTQRRRSREAPFLL